MGAADDMNALFEAIKNDLAHGDLGPKTAQAADAVLQNTRQRVSNAARDKTIDSIKQTIAKYLIEHTTDDE
jgi:hypothetical protein